MKDFSPAPVRVMAWRFVFGIVDSVLVRLVRRGVVREFSFWVRDIVRCAILVVFWVV
jgi:hypothetical protein